MLKQINKKKWWEIVELQKKLDQSILTKVKLKKPKIIIAKILALKVEVAELANEVRSFKFWSKKPKAKQDIICEEYVDGLHFLLSLGLDLGFDLKIEKNNLQRLEKEDLNEVFLKIFKLISNFYDQQNFINYQKLFYFYLSFAAKLNLTFHSIYQSYLRKNHINHDRQKKNY